MSGQNQCRVQGCRIIRVRCPLRLVDESYWNLGGYPSAIDVLGTGKEGGEPRLLHTVRGVGYALREEP